MAHRTVAFDMEYTTHILSSVKKSLKHYLISNHRTKIIEFAENLELFLDKNDELCHINIITLVRTFTKEEKSHYISQFLDNTDSTFNSQILCTTSGVGNAGIDSPSIRAVYRIDFPLSILDLS